jgi:hypothetical protein
MRPWIDFGRAAALVVAMLALGSAAGNAAPVAHGDAQNAGIARMDVAPATDLSARRRAHRHVRHHRRGYRASQPAYYARPYYYRPDGMAPFFPFRYGYGLEPSW